MQLEESSLFSNNISDPSQDAVLVVDLSSYFEDASDENAAWIQIDQLRKALSVFRKSNERSTLGKSATGKASRPQQVPQTISVSVFSDRIVLEAVIRTQSRVNGFVKTEVSEGAHSIINPTNNPNATFVTELRILQEVADKFPGGAFRLSTSEIKNRLLIKQGTTHLCVELRDSEEHRGYLASLGAPISQCTINPIGLSAALNYFVTMARSDGGHKNQSVSIQNGSAMSGGGDLLAVWESSTLIGVDANLPLKSANLYSRALSKLHPIRSRFIKFTNSYIFTDGSISVGSEAGIFLAGSNKIVDAWRYESTVDISKDTLLDSLRLLRVITHINASSAMDERHITESSQTVEKDRDLKKSVPPIQDGKTVEITVCGDGEGAALSLFICDPTGKGIGCTPKPLSCVRKQIDPTDDTVKKFKVMVDLADWLRAVDMTPGDTVKLSVALAKAIPQALVVTGSGLLDRSASEPSPYTTRCFLSLRRRGRNGKK